MNNTEDELLKQVEASMGMSMESESEGSKKVSSQEEYDTYLYETFKDHNNFTGVKEKRTIEAVCFRSLAPLSNDEQHKSFEEALPLTFSSTDDADDNSEVLEFINEGRREITGVMEAAIELYRLKERYKGIIVYNNVYSVH